MQKTCKHYPARNPPNPNYDPNWSILTTIFQITTNTFSENTATKSKLKDPGEDLSINSCHPHGRTYHTRKAQDQLSAKQIGAQDASEKSHQRVAT